MSRRFGRNQRRRAREEVARMDAEVARINQAFEMEKGLCQEISKKAARLQEEINRAKDLLPEGSILFEPGEFRLNGPANAPIHMPVLGNVGYRPSDAIPKFETFRSIPLTVLLTEAVLDELSGQLHFNVQFADGKWRYSVDRRALVGSADTRRRMVEEISFRLAKQLVIDLNNPTKIR